MVVPLTEPVGTGSSFSDSPRLVVDGSIGWMNSWWQEALQVELDDIGAPWLYQPPGSFSLLLGPL